MKFYDINSIDPKGIYNFKLMPRRPRQMVVKINFHMSPDHEPLRYIKFGVEIPAIK